MVYNFSLEYKIKKNTNINITKITSKNVVKWGSIAFK